MVGSINDGKAAESVSSGSIYSISESELNELKLKSMSGDKDAAFRISKYYTFSKIDENESMFWLMEAAKKGHPLAQYNLSFKLLHDKKPDVIGAEFWARKALINGEQDAKFLIDEIMEIKTSNMSGGK